MAYRGKLHSFCQRCLRLQHEHDLWLRARYREPKSLEAAAGIEPAP